MRLCCASARRVRFKRPRIATQAVLPMGLGYVEGINLHSPTVCLDGYRGFNPPETCKTLFPFPAQHTSWPAEMPLNHPPIRGITEIITACDSHHVRGFDAFTLRF